MNKIKKIFIIKNKYILSLFKNGTKTFKSKLLQKNIKNNIAKYGIKTFNFLKNNTYISFVVIPTIIVSLYYLLLASPRYESTAIISLKQNSSVTSEGTTPTGLFGGGGYQSYTNSYLLIDYIKSAQMLSHLQKDLDIKEMYQNRKIDFISRLSKNADNIDFLNYYDKMVTLAYNEQSNAITINAQGYSAKQAQKVLKNIVKQSQNVIDYISHTLARNRMKFNLEQLDIMKKKALDAQDRVIEFQNKRGIVDPESSVKSKNHIITQLKEDLSETETQLTNLRSYMNPNSTEIKALEQKALALKTQIDNEKNEFLKENPNSKKSELGDLVSNYQWLKLNAEFAMTEYQSALQSFENAKTDSQNQQSYLVNVVKPTLPDAPKYPRVIYNLITFFIILSSLYGLGRMIITIIIENR